MSGDSKAWDLSRVYGPGLPYEPVTCEEFNALLARVQRLERLAQESDE